MDASVVIPTKDRPLDLTRCLRALSRQETGRRFEVIVIDDASSPPIRQADLEAIRPVRVIRSEGVGPASARNQGLHAATGTVILFTDDDTAPSPGWVESACAFLDDHPDHVGVEGPTSSQPFDPLYERSVQNHGPGAYWTCNVAYRRDALDRLAGFADVFPAPHCEDLDLALRALRLGPIGFAPDMAVMHYPTSVTVRDIFRRTLYMSSEIVLYRRHREHFAWRLPVRLRPPFGVLRYFARALWRERWALIKSPRRSARFALVATGQLAISTFASFRHIDGDGTAGVDPRRPGLVTGSPKADHAPSRGSLSSSER